MQRILVTGRKPCSSASVTSVRFRFYDGHYEFGSYAHQWLKFSLAISNLFRYIVPPDCIIGRGGSSSEGSWVRILFWPSRRDLGQVLHSQLPVALRHGNSDTVSVLCRERL